MTVILAFLMNPKNWALMGAAAVLALLAIQTGRLSHAKADLVTARAALVDPISHRTWRDIAQSAIAGRDAALGSLAKQNAAVAALTAESARKSAANAEATANALSARRAAEKAGDDLLTLQSKLAGQETCTKAGIAFKAVKEALQ